MRRMRYAAIPVQGLNQEGAEPPLKKISPPLQKLVTIIHDTGKGNLAPPNIFFTPLSICF